MSLEIIKYNESYRAEWDAFVECSVNGTLLHTRSFFDHNPLNATDEHSFLFRKKNKTVAVLPCNLYTAEGKKILHSHARATYGGFVVKKIRAQEAMAIVGLLKETATDEKIDKLIIRNAFGVFRSRWCDESDYAMWRQGFKIRSRELETVIPLRGDEPPDTFFSASTKRSIKKANKYLTVKQSEEYGDYWELLSKNLSEKYGLTPTHSYDEFKTLQQCVGRDKVKLFAAFLHRKMIAGVVLLVANRRVVHAQYIGSYAQYQELRPLNAVIDAAIRWAAAGGFRYLNLGTSNYDNGKKLNEGLFRFKEGFGGCHVLRETMHLELSSPGHGQSERF